MTSRTRILLVLLVLFAIAVSCAKIEETQGEAKGLISKEALPYIDSIPSEWGNLVSVSSVEGYSYWVQLWFQDSSGNIRMVPFDIENNRFHENFRLIPRK